jgi:hypothetical protein
MSRRQASAFSSVARSRPLWAAALLGLAVSSIVALVSLTRPAPVAAQQSPIPVLAYYYIWFDNGSWERAKTDYPLLGRYSSDDKKVMQEHIRLAKKAGIDGFIVSWKSTAVLNRRLEQLMQVADVEDFKLAIIYQGLNFERDPQPVDRVAKDLDYFIEHYAGDKAFTLFERPLVIWSGTWEFKPADIAKVTRPRLQHLLILASERNLEGYGHLADYVSGDAYYWSSVDPSTYPRYPEKLTEMSDAIHARGGIWIAPAAPGFDARLIGGSRIVDRNDGATLRAQMDTAMKSSPDAVGLISWNEFSENSHVEPSVNYGTRSLEVLADIRGTTFASAGDFDSSEPGGTDYRLSNLAVLITIGLIILASIAAIVWRERGNRGDILQDPYSE